MERVCAVRRAMKTRMSGKRIVIPPRRYTSNADGPLSASHGLLAHSPAERGPHHEEERLDDQRGKEHPYLQGQRALRELGRDEIPVAQRHCGHGSARDRGQNSELDGERNRVHGRRRPTESGCQQRQHCECGAHGARHESRARAPGQEPVGERGDHETTECHAAGEVEVGWRRTDDELGRKRQATVREEGESRNHRRR